MRSFLIALQFLTIIPVKLKHVDEKKIAGSTAYFPLVGLLLGLILTGSDKLLSFLGLEQLYINIILTVLLIVLTGGIHMDGLADTADAFLSRKNREDMLRIMRDSRIGTMGVLSIVGIVFLKIALVSSVSIPLKPVSLLLMCILARWALVLLLFLFPYARQEGKARIYIVGTDLKVFIFSTVITLCCAVMLWKIYGLLLLLAIAVLAYGIGRFITGKIGGMTGDTLGAVSEIAEVSTLFSILILDSVWI